MQFIRQVFLSVINKPSLYLFLIIVVFSFDRANRWFDYKNGDFPFLHDVNQYYSYLPAAFIHHDLTFSYPNNYFWTNVLSNGNAIPKYTIGMAIMYSPFFFIGHTIARLNDHKTDGYSLPYKWCIHIGSLLYSIFGLWFCRKNLLNYFNEYITCLTLACIFFGTNLFYYTFGLGEMPHAYLFFIFSVFIYFTIKWRRTQQLKYLLLFSFLAGFATLIRPTECVILLFPLLLEVKNIADLKARVRLFLSYKIKLAFAFILFILPFFMQMIYWKIYADQWLFFSYGNQERFFFTDPQVINFLFSFKKGWFVYTPIMLFSLIGIILMKRKIPELFYAVGLLFIVTVYLLSCWWDWSFGGSFGCRALVQYYAFFVFGLATFISIVFNLFKERKIINNMIRSLMSIIFYLLILFNLEQSWKYKYGIIHYNGMTKEAYFYILNKDYLNDQEIKDLQKLVRPTDPSVMLQGKRDE